MAGQGNYLSPYAAQGSAINQQQQVANAMRMQSLQPLQAPNVAGAENSWTEVLAKLVEAYAGNKMQERAIDSQQQLSAQAQSDLMRGMTQFDETSKINPRQAITEAFMNPHPTVQAQAANAQKGLLTPKELSKKAVNADVLANPDNPELWEAASPVTTIARGNVVMDAQTGRLREGNKLVLGPDGQLYQQSVTGTHKIDQAPTVNTNVSVNSAQNHGLKEWFGHTGRQVDELGKQAAGAVNTLHALESLSRQAESGIFSNTTTGAATFMTNLAQAVGVPISKELEAKLANTETYNAGAIDLWNSIISSQEGGHKGIVKEEAEKIMQILPLTKHSPKARRQIAEILATGANRKINRYQTANKAFSTAVQTGDTSELGPIMQDIYLQPGFQDIGKSAQQSQQPGQVMEWEDFLKMQGR